MLFRSSKGVKTLVVANGAYGDRAAKILERLGRPHVKIDKGDSAAPSLEDVTTMLDADGTISHVWMIHCETTSGVVNPIHEVAEAVKERNRSFMVDAMSSFGALPVNMGGAGMDVMVSSSNKCIEGVPGFWFENKCGAKPNPRAALKQAQAAAKADQIVAVRIRDDRQDPFFVLPADDFYTLIGAWFDWQNGVSPFENER